MDNVFHAQSVNMLSCDINSLLCVSCSLSTCIKSIFGRGPGGNRMGGGRGGGPRAIDGWRRFCGTTSCACKQELVKASRYM